MCVQGAFMKMSVLAVSAAALITGLLSSHADATTIGNPVGLHHAADDLNLTEQVHCCHRRVRRVYYRRVIVVVPRYYYYRRCCY